MGFYSSPSFFLALAAAIVPAAALGLTGRPLKRYGMAASCIMLVLLFCTSAQALAAFALFCALATAGTFATLGSFTRGRKSLALYRVSLAATIAPLIIYKVSTAVAPLGLGESILGFIGISYVTFRAVQVLIEIRDGLITELSVPDYLYFLTFFATITSGPIDRSRRFLADCHTRLTRSEYADLLTRGILLILVGAVLQLVLASIVRGVLDPGNVDVPLPSVNAIPGPRPVRTIARAYLYALYLFLDFQGYSLMAMGASYCFGIRCPRNFRAPFAAQDIKDFWNRWHITLSTWLRDFVFMRIVRTMRRRRLIQSRVGTACIGYMANMLLMGAWHGLTVDYLAYGAYHGVLLAACEVYQKRSRFYKRNRSRTWYRALSWFVTMQLVVLGFSIFSGQLGHVVQTCIVEGIIHG